jgi:hypothetical protein
MKHDKFGKFYKDPSQKFGKKEIWWTKDNANHGGSQYKLYVRDNKVLRHVADVDEMGNIIPKHKGPIGRDIQFKDLNGVR